MSTSIAVHDKFWVVVDPESHAFDENGKMWDDFDWSSFMYESTLAGLLRQALGMGPALLQDENPTIHTDKDAAYDGAVERLAGSGLVRKMSKYTRQRMDIPSEV